MSRLAILSPVTLKLEGWPWKMIGHLFNVTSSYVHHFKTIAEFKLEIPSINAKFGSKSSIFRPVWPWNLMDDLEKNRTALLCYFKLCASFHCHVWIQTGVTVQKQLGRVLTCVTLTFDLWPWPFSWTSHLSLVKTPENFMMIHWEEYCEKDRRTEVLLELLGRS